MSITGILLLGGFVVAASLMVARILPALLALPLMAAWIAWCAGLPFLTWANEVLLGGALRLSSAIALVVFGAMFAKVIQKTGISDAIIKKAAEMAGDRPIAIAFLMLAATAFVFTGMSGLGAVLMVGSIVLPIMTSTCWASILDLWPILPAMVRSLAFLAAKLRCIIIFPALPSQLWEPLSTSCAMSPRAMGREVLCWNWQQVF